MTKKEIYLKVRKHLLQQKEPSRSEDGCVYKTNDGLMCAIGCLIPEDLWSPDMNNDCVSDLNTDILRHLGADIVKNGKRALNRLEFLEELQEIHDNIPPRGWEESLDLFAKKHRLQEAK